MTRAGTISCSPFARSKPPVTIGCTHFRRQARLIVAPCSGPQRRRCLLEVAGRDAFEIKDRNQHLETFRSPRVGWQNRRRESNALGPFANAVAHPRAMNRHRTDAGHDLARRQMPVAHQASAAIGGNLVGVPLEQTCHLGFDRLPNNKKCLRPVAQDLGQRISESPWLGELQNVRYPRLFQHPLSAPIHVCFQVA